MPTTDLSYHLTLVDPPVPLLAFSRKPPLFRRGSVTPHAVRLRLLVRWRARRVARADASRSWVPTPTGPEPAFCAQVDHEYIWGAARAVEWFLVTTGDDLAYMTRFLTVDPTPRPEPGAAGPQARRQARDAAAYEAARHLAYQALQRFELQQGQLKADLRARDELRQAERAVYAAAIALRHPHPEHLSRLDGGADQQLRSLPEEPLVVSEVRRRLTEPFSLPNRPGRRGSQ
jgi:hypothetical protein